MTAYRNDLEYLDEVLALITLVLHREVLIQRRLRGDQRQEAFLGLFLSDAEVDAILAELQGYRPPGDEAQLSLDERIIALRSHIAARVQATKHPLLPQRLADRFGLSNNEIDLLLYLLAAEVDDRYGRVYGFLHDDLTRKRLSPGLAFRLMRDTAGPMPAFRALFSSTAPLAFYRLIAMGEGQERARLPLMERPLRLEDRLVDFLLGENRLDGALFGYARLHKPEPGAVEVLPEPHRRQSVALAQQCAKDRLILEGSRHSDGDLWVAAIASRLKVPLLELDWRQLARLERNRRHDLLVIAQREARLLPALLHLRNLEEAADEDIAEFDRLLMGPLCLSSGKSRPWAERGFTAQVIALPELPLQVRANLWRQTLASAQTQGVRFSADRVELDQRFAELYPLSCRELEEIGQGLASQRLLGDAEAAGEQQISVLCKRMLGRAMDQVAQRIETAFGFEDLVLPPATLGLLREILTLQQHGGRVLQEWELGRLFHQNRGCRALFTGPSGTGKTMAASVLANELGLELYRIDLAQVVSKYIGETEKNLDRVFDAAARARVVLFIDEADALFGKRSEVKDAHDRYANIETSFLLQKMEEYEGVAILATNLSQNMDEAFFRRIDSVIEFPMPQESDRLRLWQRLCASSAPISPEVDLPLLARNFELAGGHIKNCILGAAYYAAEQGVAIDMSHLIRAVGREYMKIGRPISKSTFGEFYPGIRKTLSAC